VVEDDVLADLRPLLEAAGSYFCTPDQTRVLGPLCFDMQQMRMRPEAVGQSARVLAERAGFRVPEGTRLLLAECSGVGRTTRCRTRS